MSSLKQIKQMEKNALQQQQIVLDLNAVAKDIERCEKTIIDLKTELEAVNSKFQGQRNTREDIEYLTALLKCANKKLTWEKHMASLQKRTPAILERMTKLLNDPNAAADENMRAQIVQSLQAIQAAMQRLQNLQA